VIEFQEFCQSGGIVAFFFFINAVVNNNCLCYGYAIIINTGLRIIIQFGAKAGWLAF